MQRCRINHDVMTAKICQNNTIDSCLRRSSTSYEGQEMKRLAMYINKGTRVVLCFFQILMACTLSCTCLQYKFTGRN